jgi:ureidoglycolate lyase
MVPKRERNNMRTLIPAALTPAAFAPFGEVLEASPAARQIPINYGATTRFDDLAQLDLVAEGGRPSLSLFRSTPLPPPVVVRLMERHPLGSQSFIPVSGRPYLVVVAPAGPFDAGRIAAFLAAPGQGVSYRRGTWHHYSLALGEVSDFVVLDRAGPGHNLDEVHLSPVDQIAIDLGGGA